MDFSVLISVYKNDIENYFLDALLSVCVNQSYRPKQLVLIVDGPILFKIEDVISKIKKENDKLEIDVIFNEYNLGLAKSLNIGLKRCKYDWVARMDADDISTYYRFEKQINYLSEHHDVSVVGGWIDEFVNSPGDLVSSTRRVPSSKNDILQMAKKRSPMNHPTVFYKKANVLSIGGYCENFGKLEDYKLWIDMLNENFILNNLQEVVVHMRVGENFIKRRSNKGEIRDWDMLQKYLIKNKMINRFSAMMNKIYIRAFIFMPKRLKRFFYKKTLRK